MTILKSRSWGGWLCRQVVTAEDARTLKHGSSWTACVLTPSCPELCDLCVKSANAGRLRVLAWKACRLSCKASSPLSPCKDVKAAHFNLLTV